uniref:Uncharacterized protein n=1 Tax=Avena sativa TaxID=4498 RepID=A0ACD5X1W5_AVESA
MINEYFCIHIDQSSNLTRLPVVLDQPDVDLLPDFVLTLANDNFYALHPPILPNPSGNGIQLYRKSKDCMASGERDDDLTNTGGIVGNCILCSLKCKEHVCLV